jgi:hypothetical protein
MAPYANFFSTSHKSKMSDESRWLSNGKDGRLNRSTSRPFRSTAIGSHRSFLIYGRLKKLGAWSAIKLNVFFY